MAAERALGLDDHLCFAVYSASHAFNRLYRPMLDELGLTYPQYLVMVLLWEHEPRSVGELGSRLLLESSTMTPILKRLENLGFVRRQRSSEDERVVRISLTETGRALEARVVAVNCTIADAIGQSAAERETLRQAVVQMRARLEEATHA